ncbi:hypothetical protein UFOVP724_18 [uncultured Caudovirales phage]|uniref:Uncharacterized protein n=1 Tax=uncultured Caudovirales phage TaxID=2100421 RepID=A0A6J5NLU5_9CAUD|nr:hypothetical protein UFOVP724_18 [uncultured Caudovirales phage]
MRFSAQNLQDVLNSFGMTPRAGTDLSSYFEGGFFNRESFNTANAALDEAGKREAGHLGDALDFAFGRNSKDYTSEAIQNAGRAYQKNGQVGLGNFALPTHSSSQLMNLMETNAAAAAFGGAAIGGIVGAAMGNDAGESAVFGGVAGAAMFGMGRGLRSGAFMEQIERRAISSVLGKSHDELVAGKQAVYRGRLEGEVERNREIVQQETQKSMNNEEMERLVREQGTPEEKMMQQREALAREASTASQEQFVGIDRRTNQPVTKQQLDNMPDEEKQFFYGVNDNLSREEYFKERQMSGGDFSIEELGAVSDIVSSLNKQNTESIDKLIKNVGDDLNEIPQEPPKTDVEKLDLKQLAEDNTRAKETPTVSKPEASADEAFGDGNENIFNNTKTLDVDSLEARYKAKDTPHLNEMDSEAMDLATSTKIDMDDYFHNEEMKKQYEAEQAINNTEHLGKELANSFPEEPGFIGQAEGELFFNDDLSQAPAILKFDPKKIDPKDSKQKIIPDGSEKEHVVKSRDGIREELTGNESFDELAERLERVDTNQSNRPLYNPDKTIVEGTQEDVNFFNRQALLNFKPQTYAEHTRNMSAEELNAFEKQLADEQFAAHSERVQAAGYDLSRIPELKEFNAEEAFGGKQINPREALNKAYNSEYDNIVESQKRAAQKQKELDDFDSSHVMTDSKDQTNGKLNELKGDYASDVKMDYEKTETNLYSGTSLNRLGPNATDQQVAAVRAEHENMSARFQANRTAGEDYYSSNPVQYRRLKDSYDIQATEELFPFNEIRQSTRTVNGGAEGPPETKTLNFRHKGSSEALKENEELIDVQGSNYNLVGEKTDPMKAVNASKQMLKVQDLLSEGRFDNMSRPLANKELLQEAVATPTTSFMGKQAQKLLRSGPDHNVGMQTRHMVLGGSMLAGAAFGSKRKDHSRGFNSHRGNRI